MFVQVTFLSESQVAVQLVFEWTNERSFFRVDTQMIVEVMPFSKVHRAPRMVAFQDFKESLSLRILELENSEGSRGRYMMLGFSLVNFDFREVLSTIRTLDDFNELAIRRDLLLHTFIIDGVPSDFGSHHLMVLWIAS